MTAEGVASEGFIDRKGLHRQGVVFSVILIGVGLWNLPFLWYPFGEDHALAHLIGKLILEGSVPYRDVLNYKPPGVFYLHALIVGLVGDGMHWVRIADLMSLWVTMTMMLLVASHLRSPGDGLWGALLFGLAYPLMGGFGTRASKRDSFCRFCGGATRMPLVVGTKETAAAWPCAGRP